MKAILEYQLPEEMDSYEDAMNGTKMRIALDEVWNQAFRPRHRHGYSNQRLNQLLETEEVAEAMDIIEQIYKDVLTENGIDL